MTHPRLIAAIGAALFGVVLAASAAPPGERAAARSQMSGAAVEKFRLPAPVYMAEEEGLRLAADLRGAEGMQTVLIRLTEPSVGKARKSNPGLDARAHKAKVGAQQDRFLVRGAGKAGSMKVLARTQLVLNGVFAEVDASELADLAADPDVMYVKRVRHYQMDLSETVPYIGATALQNAGFDGTGIKVAVLDSGIDYTHIAFGGSGLVADYIAAYGTDTAPNGSDDRHTTLDGLFPTAKVVAGYDFVGEDWPFGPLAPDPDPIPANDLITFGGHGTHVADIVGGITPGAPGVAPGVDLYAVKTCAAYSPACNGIALIQGMEFSVDPDGDGDPADAVDVINMSLGSNYGQPFDDDLAAAVDAATALGVLTVASAGNSADKPYVTGTPAAAPTALSVAQTHVPSAFQPLMEVTAPPGIAGFYAAVYQTWSAPLAGPIEAPLLYGDGAGANLDGCAPFAPGSLSGFIVLVDRGGCFFTTKIFNIGNAGGLVGIIAQNIADPPFNGGFADPGGPITIPGYMISQVDGFTLKAGLPETVVRFDPGSGLPLIGSMVSSSSRGPSNYYTGIKPEIGAPGASVSAASGTGTGTNPFGGTSGAAPMVAGSAALLLDAYPDLTPAEVKARLMTTGETMISNEVSLAGSPLAPITRIGGGEVRVDAAAASPVVAWDDDTGNGALALGFIDVSKDVSTVQRKVRLRNTSEEDVVYTIVPTFRFADDEASAAVEVKVQDKVRVGAGKEAVVPVTFKFFGGNLPGNFMNSGSRGADGAALTLNEYDGYLIFDGDGQVLQMAWHVIPRQAADVVARQVLNLKGGQDTVSLNNIGVGTAQNDAFALLATSPNLPEGPRGGQSPMPDLRAVGINTFPVPAGFCSGSDSFVWAFALNTWERQTHLVPVVHNVFLDIDRDGIDDYVVFNFDLSFSTAVSDGRQLTWAQNLATGSASAFFFAEHSMNTGNTVLYICGEQVGLTGTDLLNTNVNMSVFTQDFYFGGPGDFVGGLTVTPLGERYFALPTDLAGKSGGTMDVFDFGLFPGNTDELGIMLNTNGDRGFGAYGGATQDTESLLFMAK